MEEVFTLLNGQIKMQRQDMMPSEDGMWLAACLAPFMPNMTVADVFSGSGLVGLCALHHGARHVTAFEKEQFLVNLGNHNAVLNNAATAWRGVCTDIEKAEGVFDVVLGNPPFHAERAGFSAQKIEKRKAHGLSEGDLSAWLKMMWYLTSDGGVMGVIVHSRELNVLEEFSKTHNVGGLLYFLKTSELKPAKRIIALFNNVAIGMTRKEVLAYDIELRDRILKQGLPFNFV